MVSNVQWAVSVSSTDLATQVRANMSKIKILNNYLDIRELLWVYLVQLKLYIEFNISQFSLNQEKTLFEISCLHNKTFNWIEALLQEFLKKLSQEKRADTSVISNYVHYKKEIKKHFGVVNEAQAAETKLLSLWQKHSAVKYAVKFQHITSLTDWNNSVLTALYYWGLREFIKDEIVRADWPEILQDMVDLVIQIDSCQWERQRERKRHQHKDYRQSKYTEHRYYLNSMNLNEFEKCDCTSRVSEHRKDRDDSQNNQLTKIYDKKSQDSLKTQKCYNCGKSEHLARDCKRPKKRSEIKAFAAVLHESLSWTACYDDMCWVHQSDKNSSEWYLWWNKQKKNHEEYNTINLSMKDLNTLKKSVTSDMSTEAEIEETDIWET